MLSVRVLETRNIVGNERFPEPNPLDEDRWHISDDYIELPRGALIENSDNGLVRIVFVAFDRLETILRPTWLSDAKAHSVTDSTERQQQQLLRQLPGASGGAYGQHGQPAPPPRQRILNSKVISASLGKGRHIELSQPIRLVLRHLRTVNVTNPVCVFWNYIDQ